MVMVLFMIILSDERDVIGVFFNFIKYGNWNLRNDINIKVMIYRSV